MRSTVTLLLLGWILQVFAAGTAWSQVGDPALSDSSIPVDTLGDEVTDSERRILDRGEYDRGEIVGGGILGTVIGLGTGHVVQGRYKETGWIFTVGEVGSFAALLAGTGICTAARDRDEDELFPTDVGCVFGVVIGSFAVWSAFRVAEAVEVWAHPLVHNKRFRTLKSRTAEQAEAEAPEVTLQLLPREDEGATVGFAVRF